MNTAFYLTRRRETYFFRRRIPGLSTENRPVMVSLGTTDRKLALKSCAKLTAHMDWMLDNNIHMTLPEADVTAFFKAELRRVLDDLKVIRTIEHVDGTMTAQKARTKRLSMTILSNLAEDGLWQEMPSDRLAAIDPVLREEAETLHRTAFQEFTSQEFNNGVQQRASEIFGRFDFTEYDKLFLRKAALEARMGAHSAFEAYPLHNRSHAQAMALDMLLAQSESDRPDTKLHQQTQMQTVSPLTEPLPKMQCLSEGVELIVGRITARTIHQQRDQALNQPEEKTFDGNAENIVTDQIRGADLFGTAVRMIRKSRSQDDTGQQKLKSVSLFIYLTGVQLVTDIRQHHLDMFGHGLEHQLPKHYWKSDAQSNSTFKELLEINRNKPSEIIGLASPTIARHLATIVNVMRFADGENNTAGFIPRTTDLVPLDKRSDGEKRAVYTKKDAQKLFQHPLWQGCKNSARRHTKGSVIIQDHHYWINLLLAYTGARRSEIAGLLEADVGQDGEITFISIRENTLRGLKTPFSRRRVPLHPHLLELGFLDFVMVKRASKEWVLFPEAIPAKIRESCLRPGGTPPPYDKKFGDSLDHVFRECVNRSFDGNPEKYCVASLRGYVNDTFINHRNEDGITLTVPEIDRRDILGHKPRDVNEGHYRRDEKPLGPLNVAIRLLPRLF